MESFFGKVAGLNLFLVLDFDNIRTSVMVSLLRNQVQKRYRAL